MIAAGFRITNPLTPPRLPHIHPWNAGGAEMAYRQITVFEEPSHEAVQDTLGVFATISGLAREGKISRRGLPGNPLQVAATLRTLAKHGGFTASAPIPLQKFLAATLGRLAETMGYRGSYPQYLKVEPGRNE